jgi:hypothetical protein
MEEGQDRRGRRGEEERRKEESQKKGKTEGRREKIKTNHFKFFHQNPERVGSDGRGIHQKFFDLFGKLVLSYFDQGFNKIRKIRLELGRLVENFGLGVGGGQEEEGVGVKEGNLFLL